MTRVTILLENLCTFITIFRSVFLGMRNISDKSCRENQTTYFMYNGGFFYVKSCSYELMWKNIVESGRSHDNMAYTYFIVGS